VTVAVLPDLVPAGPAGATARPATAGQHEHPNRPRGGTRSQTPADRGRRLATSNSNGPPEPGSHRLRGPSRNLSNVQQFEGLQSPAARMLSPSERQRTRSNEPRPAPACHAATCLGHSWPAEELCRQRPPRGEVDQSPRRPAAWRYRLFSESGGAREPGGAGGQTCQVLPRKSRSKTVAGARGCRAGGRHV